MKMDSAVRGLRQAFIQILSIIVITVDKEKMSKSLGNFFTIKEILNKFEAEVIRFFLLSAHYRSPIEFSDEQLRESEVSIDRYYTTSSRISDFLKQDHSREVNT
jgi:cysteinyl-tRNA synthetase